MVRLFKPGLFRLILIGGTLIILGLVFWLFVWPILNNKVENDDTLNQKTSGYIEQAKELVGSQKCDEAVSLLDKAVENTGANAEKAEYLRSQASILAECGKLDQAVEVAKKADLVDPLDTSVSNKDDSEAYNQSLQQTYADVVETKKSIDTKAGGTSENTVQDETSIVESQLIDYQHLAYLYDISGDFHSAIEYYKKAIKLYQDNSYLEGTGRISYLEGRVAELEARQ